MRCLSLSTVNTDGYRAGCELGEGLRGLQPETVVVFASITYHEQFADVFAGLCDGLGRSDVLIFGGTSDGIYETDRIAHHGICALGFHAGGAVRWTAAVESGVADDSFGAAQRCARRAADTLEGQVDFAFATADGVKADGSRIVAGISSVLAGPFLGGLAADDRKFEKSWIFVNGAAHQDAVAVLAARGPIHHLINSASGWQPVGEAGTIEECHGSTVDRISGMTPQAFLREQIGKTPGETDLGMVPLAAYHPESAGHYSLRTPSHFDPATGSATMFGSMEAGTTVRVCTATLENVLNAVEEAMRTMRGRGLEPAAALLVSCAGRRWLLEDRSREEVARVLGALGQRVPLIGLPSFGEMGPFLREDGSYTPTFFHNVTFVVCLFGA